MTATEAQTMLDGIVLEAYMCLHPMPEEERQERIAKTRELIRGVDETLAQLEVKP